MRVICTYCSYHKDKSKELLPAIKRYNSSRIRDISEIAKDRGYRFYILSGEYGLISKDYKIPYYDHRLKYSEIDKLIDKVIDQLTKDRIEEVIYYTESLEQEPEVRPYICTLWIACMLCNIKFKYDIVNNSYNGDGTMGRENKPISQDDFEKYKIRLFANANKELKSFARQLADYCWKLDNYAVIQPWSNEKEALIVFGVPPHKRKVKNAKNYFSIYKVIDSYTQKLKCEVCFPIDNSRLEKLRKFDTKNKLSISTINQCEGKFTPNDYDYVVKLINAARKCRLK